MSGNKAGESRPEADTALSKTEASELLNRIDLDSHLESQLDLRLGSAGMARELLEQRRGGVDRSTDERTRVRQLERHVYGLNPPPGSESELSLLLATFRDRGSALDRAVLALAGDSNARDATPPVAPPPEPSASGHRRRFPRLLPRVLVGISVIAVCSVTGNVMQAMQAHSSLEVFIHPAVPPSSNDAMLTLKEVNAFERGPVRYLGSVGETEYFASMTSGLSETTDFTDDRICLIGVYSTGEVSGRSSCVTRAAYDKAGVSLTPNESGTASTVQAAPGAAWGPTGGLREVAPGVSIPD